MNHDTTSSTRKSPVRWKLVTAIFVLSTVVSFLGLYQQQVTTAWGDLPQSDGSLEGTEARLAAVETFLGRYPVWLGARDALSEKTELATQVQVLRNRHTIDSANDRAEAVMQVDAADSAGLGSRWIPPGVSPPTAS